MPSLGSCAQTDEKSLKSLQEEIHECLEASCVAFQEDNLIEFSDILELDLAPKLETLQEGIYRMINASEKKLH